MSAVLRFPVSEAVEARFSAAFYAYLAQARPDDLVTVHTEGEGALRAKLVTLPEERAGEFRRFAADRGFGALD